jgi:L-alanine-DL-glutamate epimerase-like enolase superfamily enzyme
VVALETDTGLTGWGEVCPIPHYLPAYARGVAPALQELAPVLLGADPVGVEALMARADACIFPAMTMPSPPSTSPCGTSRAQAADCRCTRCWAGGAGRPAALSLDHLRRPDEMARMAARPRTKACASSRPSWAPIGRLAGRCRSACIRVREAVGPGPLVYGDWNCGATRLDATRVGRAVARPST